jgi:malonyl-CoA O-methyltransferase
MASSPNDSQREARIAPISVAAVRRLFARPQRCAESQFLRREIAARMLERLALIRLSPATMLDAGCGEGQDLLGLQQAFPDAQLLAVDASVEMLAAARASAAQSRSGMQKLISLLLGSRLASQHASAVACADFARLPLPRASIDFLWSNLALHWHPQPHTVIHEWARVLRTDGLLMFSCFGPDTFIELREVFSALGLPNRVLPFVDLHDYGDMLVSAGMAAPVMDMEKLTLTYASAEHLLADVRAFGGNPLIERPRGLDTPRWLERVTHALEQQRDQDGKLRLTMEVIYGHAFRPEPRATTSGEHIMRFEPRPR